MAKKKPFDLDLAISLYQDHQWSTSRIADKFCVHLQTVINRLRDANVQLRPQGQAASDINPRMIKDLYLQKGLSVRQISEQLNVSASLVRKKLRECGIRIKRSGSQYRAIDIDKDELKQLYCQDRLTIRACAKHFGVSDGVIRRRLDALHIPIRKSIRRFINDIDDDAIVDLYWNKGLSISQVARKIGHSANLVRNRLNSSGRGTRSVADGARLWRGSDDISDDQLIYLYDVCGWSCEKISVYFGKSAPFTRHRFMSIGKARRQNIGKNNGSWKGGITDIRNAVRSCAASLQWRKKAFDRQQYCSEISGNQAKELNCHHIYPFHAILQASITKHRPLPDEYRSLAIIGDPRFYDDNNGLVISKEEHDKIEMGKLEKAHPWWKIWRCFQEFSISRSGLTNDDFVLFGESGSIRPIDYNIVPSTTKIVKPILRYEHYLGTIQNPILILTAKRNNVIIGVAVFGRGMNRCIKDNVLELTRLCVPFYVEKPFACQFLNDCCDYIKINHPNITQLISFADSSVGHDGGVYRIAGWAKAGKTPPSYAYFDPVALQLRHKSSCRRIKGIDKTEKQLADERGLIKIPLGHKYRYILEL